MGEHIEELHILIPKEHHLILYGCCPLLLIKLYSPAVAFKQIYDLIYAQAPEKIRAISGI